MIKTSDIIQEKNNSKYRSASTEVCIHLKVREGKLGGL